MFTTSSKFCQDLLWLAVAAGWYAPKTSKVSIKPYVRKSWRSMGNWEFVLHVLCLFVWNLTTVVWSGRFCIGLVIFLQVKFPARSIFLMLIIQLPVTFDLREKAVTCSQRIFCQYCCEKVRKTWTRTRTDHRKKIENLLTNETWHFILIVPPLSSYQNVE